MGPPVRAKAVEAPWITLPRFSPYGPFIVFETLPLLLFASVLRFASFGNGWPTGPILMSAEAFAIVLAFIVATWRMIETTDHETRLGHLDLAKHFGLGGDIFFRLAALTLGVFIVAFALGFRQFAHTVLIGIDGVTFHQGVGFIPIWSSFVAVLMFVMVLNNEKFGSCSIRKAFSRLGSELDWTGSAFAVLAVCLVSFDQVQSLVRYLVYLFAQTSEPQIIKNCVLLFYLFAFAVTRLWLIVTVLSVALRKHNERARLRKNVALSQENE